MISQVCAYHKTTSPALHYSIRTLHGCSLCGECRSNSPEKDYQRIAPWSDFL